MQEAAKRELEPNSAAFTSPLAPGAAAGQKLNKMVTPEAASSLHCIVGYLVEEVDTVFGCPVMSANSVLVLCAHCCNLRRCAAEAVCFVHMLVLTAGLGVKVSAAGPS